MPWKVTSVMDERMKFVGRLLTGEKMAHLCKEFGISRVTGYKIWNPVNFSEVPKFTHAEDIYKLSSCLYHLLKIKTF